MCFLFTLIIHQQEKEFKVVLNLIGDKYMTAIQQTEW